MRRRLMGVIALGSRWRPTDYLLEELRLYGAGVEMDLENIDLAGSDLTGATLTGASLRGANLRGAILDRACLRDVTLAALTSPEHLSARPSSLTPTLNTQRSVPSTPRHPSSCAPVADRGWLVGLLGL